MLSKEQEFAAKFDGNLESFHAPLKANNSPLMRFWHPAPSFFSDQRYIFNEDLVAH